MQLYSHVSAFASIGVDPPVLDSAAVLFSLHVLSVVTEVTEVCLNNELKINSNSHSTLHQFNVQVFADVVAVTALLARLRFCLN